MPYSWKIHTGPVEHSVPLRVLLQRLYRSESFRLLVIISALLYALGGAASYATGDWGILEFMVILPLYLITRLLVFGFITLPLWIALGVAWAAYELFHKKQPKRKEEKRGQNENVASVSSQTT